MRGMSTQADSTRQVQCMYVAAREVCGHAAGACGHTRRREGSTGGARTGVGERGRPWQRAGTRGRARAQADKALAQAKGARARVRLRQTAYTSGRGWRVKAMS